MNNSIWRSLFAIVTAVCVAAPAFGADLPATGCEIFLKKVGVAPSSHGFGAMPVVVKVGWIGNGEQIERVGFYGFSRATDLGNASSCNWSPQYDDRDWKIHEPQAGGYYATEYGEYSFSFPVHSGSVVSICPGFQYTWVGTFFVQTSKNTYWVNPDMDSSKYFYFDDNGWDNLERFTYMGVVSTARSELRYYNPRECR